MRERGASRRPPYWAPMSVGCVWSPLAEHRCIGKGKGDNTQTDWTNIQYVLFFFFLNFFFFTAENLSVWLCLAQPQRSPASPHGSPFPTCTHGAGGSDQPVTFVRRWVRDDVAALGGVPFPGCPSPGRGGACGVQVQRHFLRDESVQVDVLEAVAPAAAGRYGAGGAAAAASSAAAPAHVCGRPGSAGAHADARHGPTQTCGRMNARMRSRDLPLVQIQLFNMCVAV